MRIIRLKAIVFDQTRYWSGDIATRAERIYQTYLFDAQQSFQCCELTPSYELWPLYATPLIDDDEGTLSSEIMLHESSDLMYVHARSIDATPSRFVEDLGTHEVDDDESAEEAFQRQLEHYRCNVVLQVPKAATRLAT